jgi:transcriptional regulator with XRE-family HTH domain
MLSVVNIVLMTTESLANYVSRIMREKGLSFRDVQTRSGYNPETKSGISGAYVNQIANDQILPEKLSIEKIKALAKGLGESEEILFAKVRGVKPDVKYADKEKFENLGLKFSGIPSSKKDRADALYELIEREIDRLTNEK